MEGVEGKVEGRFFSILCKHFHWSARFLAPENRLPKGRADYKAKAAKRSIVLGNLKILYGVSVFNLATTKRVVGLAGMTA